MKKQFGLPLMLASVLAFSACSSENVTPDNNGGSYDFTKGGFMTVKINLPSQTSTDLRAENDKFDDGLPAEYAVKNAVLVLFEGTDEATATYHSMYSLGDLSMEMDGEPQITSTTKIVAKANNNAQNKNLWGLVILNNNNLVDVAAQTINNVAMAGKTISDLNTSIHTGVASDFNANGFLMMNAPLATEQGGDNTPSATAGVATLVNVTSNVYSTQAEAMASAAANFYVERALAKVTFLNGHGTIKGGDVTLDGTPQAGAMTWSIANWNLDVTNKKSFFVHNVTGADAPTAETAIDNSLASDITISNAPIANLHRFIGHKPVRTNDLKYRTYWGIDPNYNAYAAADFTTLSANAEINGELGTEKPQYCFENTFDVANQNQDQTTRAIVKVVLNGGDDFYVFNGDKSKLYSKDGCEKRIKADIANLTSVHNWIQENLKAGETYDISATGNSTVTLGTPDVNTADVNVTAFTVKISAAQSKTGAEVSYTLASDDLTNLNGNMFNHNIKAYTGGIAYYPIRIKHFGNELTPWNNYNETTNANGHQAKAGDVYDGNRADRFLGRYGVLRNNWYELEVGNISGIGEPRVPAVTTDPDDELNNYISVNINILSWAKRSQKEDL